MLESRPLTLFQKAHRANMLELTVEYYSSCGECRIAASRSKEAAIRRHKIFNDQLKARIVSSEFYGHSILDLRVFESDLRLNPVGDLEAVTSTIQRQHQSLATQLDPHHPYTLNVNISLSVALYQQGKQKKARALLEQIFLVQKRIFGPRAHSLMGTIELLTTIRQEEANQERVEDFMEDCTKLYEMKLAPNDDKLWEMYRLLGQTYKRIGFERRDQSKFRKAEAVYKTLLDKQMKYLKRDNVTNIILLHSLATVLQQLEKTQEAERIFAEILPCMERPTGIVVPSTLEVTYQLGYTNHLTGDLEAALHYYNRALSGFQSFYGLNDKVSIRCQIILEIARAQLKAKNLLSRANPEAVRLNEQVLKTGLPIEGSSISDESYFISHASGSSMPDFTVRTTIQTGMVEEGIISSQGTATLVPIVEE